MAKAKKSPQRKRRTFSAAPQLPNAIAFTVRGFTAVGGPGKTKIYELGKKGVLEIFKDAAGRTMITGKSARALLGVKDEASA